MNLSLVVVPLAAGGSVVFGFYAFDAWFRYDPFAFAGSLPHFALAAAILMFPTSLFSGMLFPLLAESLFRNNANSTLSAGTLTFANTVGAAAGSVLAAFLMLPILGVENSLLWLALGYVIVALAAVALTAPRSLRLYAPGFGVAALIVLVFPYGNLRIRRFAAKRSQYPRLRGRRAFFPADYRKVL